MYVNDRGVDHVNTELVAELLGKSLRQLGVDLRTVTGIDIHHGVIGRDLGNLRFQNRANAVVHDILAVHTTELLIGVYDLVLLKAVGHLEADIDVGVICRCYVEGIVALTAVAGILGQNELLIADGEPLYLLGRTYDMETLC